MNLVSRGFSFILLIFLTGICCTAQESTSQPDLKTMTQQVEVNGFTFPYYDIGDGPVVLLLHGFPDSKYLWRNQLQPLADAGFRVIAPDLRGYGDAPKPKEVEAYKISTILSDLTGLLDALQIDKAHVVGHDWGGTVAWVFAGAFPQRTISITGLTVGAPGASGRRSMEQLEKFWYIFFFMNEGVAEEWLQRDNWQGLRLWTRGKGDIEHNIKNLEKEGALTAGLNWYRANFSPASLNNTSSNPPRIKMPAMGIAAENDVFLLEPHIKTSEEMVDASWRYHYMKNASHWLMLDQPTTLNTWLIDFLQEVEKNQ